MPDEFLESLLRGESTMMRDPGAYDPAGVYNAPAEPLTPEALLASLRALWDRPLAPWGMSSFSWFRKPPRRLSLFWLGGEWRRQLERSAWQEVGRSAWIESVRERLQSAVYAVDNGYGWSWEAPGVFGVPGLPEQVQVRDATQPWRPKDGDND